MTLAFRVDASQHIGSGHLMRCLTLASTAAAEGHRCVFFSRRLPSGLRTLLADRGMDLETIPGEPPAGAPEHPLPDWQAEARWLLDQLGGTPFDWLVCDHYGLDQAWEEAVGPLATRRMVIDDLANRRHECDLLVDQTYGRLACEYEELVPAHCRTLVGSDYALLRPEFSQIRERSLARRSNAGLERILVNVGGMDPDNVTGWILRALVATDLPRTTMMDVVLGSSAPHVRAVAHTIETMPFEAELSVGVTNMAERMAAADLAIGASGATAWERCCLGLPSIVITFADNQHAIARALEAAGAVLYLGDFREIESDSTSLAEAINGLASEPEALARMSAAASSVTDGLGAERVVRRMLSDGMGAAGTMRLRPIQRDDAELVFEWQSASETRRYFRDPRVPTWSEHKTWWYARLRRDDTVTRIIEVEGSPVGLVRLDPLPSKERWEVSILIAPNYKGRGYAKQALTVLCAENAGRTLVAHVATANSASQRLFESVGFSRENPETFVRRAYPEVMDG